MVISLRTPGLSRTVYIVTIILPGEEFGRLVLTTKSCAACVHRRGDVNVTLRYRLWICSRVAFTQYAEVCVSYAWRGGANPVDLFYLFSGSICLARHGLRMRRRTLSLWRCGELHIAQVDLPLDDKLVLVDLPQ